MFALYFALLWSSALGFHSQLKMAADNFTPESAATKMKRTIFTGISVSSSAILLSASAASAKFNYDPIERGQRPDDSAVIRPT